jgi:hypothetical protein
LDSALVVTVYVEDTGNQKLGQDAESNVFTHTVRYLGLRKKLNRPPAPP